MFTLRVLKKNKKSLIMPNKKEGRRDDSLSEPLLASCASAGAGAGAGAGAEETVSKSVIITIGSEKAVELTDLPSGVLNVLAGFLSPVDATRLQLVSRVFEKVPNSVIHTREIKKIEAEIKELVTPRLKTKAAKDRDQRHAAKLVQLALVRKGSGQAPDYRLMHLSHKLKEDLIRSLNIKDVNKLQKNVAPMLRETGFFKILQRRKRHLDLFVGCYNHQRSFSFAGMAVSFLTAILITIFNHKQFSLSNAISIGVCTLVFLAGLVSLFHNRLVVRPTLEKVGYEPFSRRINPNG